jgi:hypothetical protein
MKTLLIGLAVASLAAVVCGCAILPSRGDIIEAVTDPAVDAAAVRFETALYVMTTSIAPVVADPSADLDQAKFAKRLRNAAADLDQARAMFDARSGDPVALTKAAFDRLDEAVPVGSSLKVRLALSAGRTAVSIFASSLSLAGPPSPPSEALVLARARTDRAVAELLARLPDI